jgi:hypothetical protein
MSRIISLIVFLWFTFVVAIGSILFILAMMALVEAIR